MLSKKNKKAAAVLLSSLMLFASGGHMFAAQSAQDVEARLGGDNKVTVTGVHPLGKDMRVTLSVTDPYGSVFYRRELAAGVSGNFTAVFLMDDVGETEEAVDKSGTYTVSVGGAGLQTANTSFHFVNHITGMAIVEAANRAVTAEQVNANLFTEGAPNTFADQLRLEYKENSAFDKLASKNAVYLGMAGISGRNRYASAAEVIGAFNTAVAVQTLNETAKADAKCVIERYAELLKLDLGDDSNFARLAKESSKSTVYEKMTGGKLDTANAGDAIRIEFEKAVYTELVNEVDIASLEKLVDYITACNREKYTDISLNDYHSAKLTDLDRASILKSVLKQQPFSDLAKLKTAFEEVSEAKRKEAEEDNQGVTSGKNSGGGGNRSTSVKIGNAGDPSENGETQEETSGKSSSVFSDLDSVSWAVEAIDYLAQRNVISGVEEGCFMPNAPVRREEFVKMLMLALDVSAEETEKTFEDVKSDTWYYQYVMKAYAANIIKGVDFDIFGIGQPITREQMCTILYRAMNLLDIHIEDNEKKLAFSDKAMISDYAADAVECLYRAGIVNGMSNTEFNPKGETSRAMAAQVIYQLMKRGDAA